MQGFLHISISTHPTSHLLDGAAGIDLVAPAPKTSPRRPGPDEGLPSSCTQCGSERPGCCNVTMRPEVPNGMQVGHQQAVVCRSAGGRGIYQRSCHARNRSGQGSSSVGVSATGKVNGCLHSKGTAVQRSEEGHVGGLVKPKGFWLGRVPGFGLGLFD